MSVKRAVMVPHPPLIIPEVGRGEERGINATAEAFRAAANFIAEDTPDTIVITSPHATLYADYFHISPGRGASGSFAQFGAPQASFEAAYDSEFVRELEAAAKKAGLSAGTQGERNRSLDHATMVPLRFLEEAFHGRMPRIVRVGLSGLPLSEHYKLGELIAKTAERLGRKTAIVASGDLSHRLKTDGPYGFAKEGPEYDSRIMKVMGSGDFGGLFYFSEEFCEGAGECGHRSFTIMAGAFDGRSVNARRLSYEGPFGVGYGVCLFEAGEADEGRRFLKIFEEREKRRLEELRANEDPYVKLARASFESIVRTGRRLTLPDGLPKELTERRAGTFVSLHKDGRLRGCIGTTAPTAQSTAQEIINNAVSAATQDPRFDPVEADELDRIECTVDVLGPTEPIDSPAQLDVKRYGVIVSRGYKRGLLLPNLDGVTSVEQQIAISRQKAGIRPDESVSLERFEVVRHY